ncbi:uncharacterized protein LOC120349930 isoform X2 [Nilaparvata lugens]|uniref:uncharacterized protein LOC120349930 isoform X2 n=1 Tax=Nilaparvata lugens TaxID=108931 RepID=UPI00193DF189|nr:uncharacterized protein LOC120349930 isoform X2 [Nilaparvata lugens]
MEDRPSAESLISIFGDKRVTGLKAFILLSLTLPIFLNLIFCLIEEWSDFFDRLLTLKEIMLILFSAIGGYVVQFHLRDVEEKYILKYLANAKNYETSDEKRKIINETNDYITRHNIVAQRAFKFLFISGGCLPLLQITIKTLKMYLTGAEAGKMAFVIHLYLPEGYKTPLMYLSTQLAAFVLYGFLVYMWGVNYKVFLIGLKCISSEVSLLIESLKELDGFEKRRAIAESTGNEEPLAVVSADHERRLKDHLNRTVEHHQDILLSLKLVNDCTKLYIFLFINVYSIQLGLYIIFVIKGEKLRMALYSCSWLDKPQWMKRCLVLMIMKANQPLELRPYGLYALNKSCMANMMKATYTYVNVVNELLSRK